MRHSDNPPRPQILAQALAATTLPEIETAVHALRQWVHQHPADTDITAAFEQLSLMQDIAEEQAAARLLNEIAQLVG